MHTSNRTILSFVTPGFVISGLIASIAAGAPRAHAQVNLVANGDFSAGNTAFFSDYMFEPSNNGITTVHGEYGVVTNPSTAYSNAYASYGDHTTGTGNMLFADGSSSATDRVWYQTVNLTANTIYNYSYWGASPDPTSPATLRFSAAGTQIGTDFTLSSTAGLFQQTSGTFNSGAGGNVVLAISDTSTVAVGNDITIDDIRVSAAAASAPEPSALALLASAFLMFSAIARRRLTS